MDARGRTGGESVSSSRFARFEVSGGGGVSAPEATRKASNEAGNNDDNGSNGSGGNGSGGKGKEGSGSAGLAGTGISGSDISSTGEQAGCRPVFCLETAAW